MRKKGRSHDVRLRVQRARVSSECCVVLSRSSPLSCHVCGLLVCGALCGVTSPEGSPKGVDPTAAAPHSVVCSYRDGPELLGSILLGFCELASAECVNLTTCHESPDTGSLGQIARESRRWNSRLQTLRLPISPARPNASGLSPTRTHEAASVRR